MGLDTYRFPAFSFISTLCFFSTERLTLSFFFSLRRPSIGRLLLVSLLSASASNCGPFGAVTCESGYRGEPARWRTR